MTTRLFLSGALLAAASIPTAALASSDLTIRSSAGAGYQYSGASAACYYNITRTGGTCSDSHAGPASASSSTISPNGGDGHATQASSATYAAGGGASGSSQVTADYASASTHLLAGSANAAPANGLGVVTGAAQSGATMNDMLHFTIQGASAATITQVGVTFTLAGSLAAPGYRDAYYSPVGEVYGAAVFGSVPSDFYLLNSSSTNYVTTASLNNYPSSHANTWSTNADHTINVSSFVYDLVGSSVDVPVSLNITDYCRYGSVCDTTTSFALTSPTGVSYTSDSGVFLKGNAVGSVPEPVNWALMIAGFGIIGGSARRRRMITCMA